MTTQINVALNLREEDVRGLLELGVDVNTTRGADCVRRIVLNSLLSRIRPDLLTQSPEGNAFTHKAIHPLMPK